MRRGKSSNGVARSNPCACAASSSVCRKFAEVAPGPSPPSNKGRDQSATTFAGSKSYFDPNPLHAGQAPYGELKLDDLGSSCGTEMPHSLHAPFSEPPARSRPPPTTLDRTALREFERGGGGGGNSATIHGLTGKAIEPPPRSL